MIQLKHHQVNFFFSTISIIDQLKKGSSGKTKLLFTDWLNKIDENFEKQFWIDETNSSEYVHRRFIYKDTINSSLKWTDFQFRPNFLVAAVLVFIFLSFLLFTFLLSLS